MHYFRDRPRFTSSYLAYAMAATPCQGLTGATLTFCLKQNPGAKVTPPPSNASDRNIFIPGTQTVTPAKSSGSSKDTAPGIAELAGSSPSAPAATTTPAATAPGAGLNFGDAGATIMGYLKDKNILTAIAGLILIIIGSSMGKRGATSMIRWIFIIGGVGAAGFGLYNKFGKQIAGGAAPAPEPEPEE